MKFFLYLMAITTPFFLGLTVWQSVRYDSLKQEVRRLNEVQEEIILSNKKLLTEIAALSSPERLERIAVQELGLTKITPESRTIIGIGSKK